MEVLERIFAKPFEVTQFWSSDRYSAMGMAAGDTVGHLFKYCPDHVRKYRPPQGVEWFFEVRDGEGGPFGGDFLPNLLPTRHNIALLNAACIKASHALIARLEGNPRGADTDNVALFPDVVPYRGDGEMTIANERYQRDLWQVFADDWGLALPVPERFGIDPVTITYRPGLPCAAAMIRAVKPIIEAAHDNLELDRQFTLREGERQFDVVEYRCTNGEALVQRYDITDVYGRDDLDWMYIGF